MVGRLFGLLSLFVVCAPSGASARPPALLPGMPPTAAAALRDLAEAPNVAVAILEILPITPAGSDAPEWFRVRVLPVQPWRAKAGKRVFALKPAAFRALGLTPPHSLGAGGTASGRRRRFLAFSGVTVTACFPVENGRVATPWGRYAVTDFIECVRRHGKRPAEHGGVAWHRVRASGNELSQRPLPSPSGQWVYFDRSPRPARGAGFVRSSPEAQLWICDVRRRASRLVSRSCVSRCLAARGDALFYIERNRRIGAKWRLRRFDPATGTDDVVFSWDVAGRPVLWSTPAERPVYPAFLLIETLRRDGSSHLVTIAPSDRVLARLDGSRAARTADGIGMFLDRDGLGHVVRPDGTFQAVGTVRLDAVRGRVLGLPMLLPNRRQLGYNVRRCHASRAQYGPDGSRWEICEAYIVDLDGSHRQRVLPDFMRVTLHLPPRGPAVAHCWGLGGAVPDRFFALVPDPDRPGCLTVPANAKPLDRPPVLYPQPRRVTFRGWSVRGILSQAEAGEGRFRIAVVDPTGWFHYLSRPDGKGDEFPAEFATPPAWIPGRAAFAVAFGGELWLCELRLEAR